MHAILPLSVAGKLVATRPVPLPFREPRAGLLLSSADHAPRFNRAGRASPNAARWL